MCSYRSYIFITLQFPLLKIKIYLCVLYFGGIWAEKKKERVVERKESKEGGRKEGERGNFKSLIRYDSMLATKTCGNFCLCMMIAGKYASW